MTGDFTESLKQQHTPI